jgi:hypothetical protein
MMLQRALRSAEAQVIELDLMQLDMRDFAQADHRSYIQVRRCGGSASLSGEQQPIVVTL